MNARTDQVLADLAATIAARRDDAADRSYTASLLEGGVEACAQKFGEEAIELIVAAMGGKHGRIAREGGDVLYHFLVLLEASGVSLSQVLDVLASRRGVSGHEEKSARARN